MPAYKDNCPRCGREFTNYTDPRGNRQFCSVGCQFAPDPAAPLPVDDEETTPTPVVVDGTRFPSLKAWKEGT